MNFSESIKQSFDAVSDVLFNSLTTGEELNISLHAEDSIFVRFNANKVRQNTHVYQKGLTLTLQSEKRTSNISFTLSGDFEFDKVRALETLNLARQECQNLPVDEFQVPMVNNGSSNKVFKGNLLSFENLFEAIMEPAANADLAGLYCAGPIVSANRNSKGQSHFFATENFFFDYSLYHGEKAVKAVYAGTDWKQADYEQNLKTALSQLELMKRPKKVLAPGKYRAYLAPAASAELFTMLSWGSLSYSQYKQGNCSLGKLADNEKQLSPLFSVRENFDLGLTHQYNSLGEISAAQVELISEGRLKSFLISSRSSKEYGVPANGAGANEAPRSLEVANGSLKRDDILKEIGTGLYLSNLHYLNWSDRLNARITGMTRYACFWVEDGEIVAPIADLRFDESLYDCLGENLEAVTDFREIDPSVGTYEARTLGGSKLPGLLIKDFKFTL